MGGEMHALVQVKPLAWVSQLVTTGMQVGTGEHKRAASDKWSQVGMCGKAQCKDTMRLCGVGG